MATKNIPNSYKDPFWSDLASNVEQQLKLPSGLLKSVLLQGERSNADQVSEAGAKTPFQIIPSTRKLVLDKYGVDAYLNPRNAAEAAGLLLKESLDRNQGDVRLAAAEYHGGTNQKNWGPRTKAYIERVSSGVNVEPIKSTFDVAMETQQAVPDSAIQNIYNAYSSGQMSPEETADFEADVKGGKIMLPRNAALKGTAMAAGASIEPILLPQEVTEAYISNQMTDQERNDLESDMRAGLVKLPPSRGSAIPVAEGVALPTEQGVIERPPEPTLGETLVGAGEAALALGTGMTGGVAGMIGGTVKGLAEQILSGDYGTPEAAKLVEESAVQGAESLTRTPRTQLGQQYTQQIGEFLGETVPPVIPMVTAPNALIQSISQAARPAAIATGAAASKAAQTSAQLARRGGQAITTPITSAVQSVRGAMAGQPIQPKVTAGSIGAAATPKAVERVATSEVLPVKVELTRGAATRDAAQLAFEKEQMKSPTMGQPLRNRAEENNVQVLQNFDALIDMTDAKTPDLSATGSAVTKALSDGYKSAKTATRVAYTKARNSPEAQVKVNINDTVTIPGRPTEGIEPVQNSLVGYLNSKPTGVPSAAVTDSIRSILIKSGLASEDANKNLVGIRATIGQLEDLRSEISGIAKFDDAIGLRDETIIKKIIDATTDPVSGPLYKKARALRTQQARKYESRGVVARLIRNRKGMQDPQVAVDQVFQKTILGGSPEEITFIKRVLNSSGEDGQQAWKELQGETLKHIRDESTKGMGLGADNQPVVSPAKLNQIIKTLDKNGRLDVIFGKKTAQTLRDLNDVVKYVNTVPPGTLVNPSGTAGTIVAAIVEAGSTGALTGLPVPVVSGVRMILKLRRDNATKAKINDALNALPIIPPE
jgi:hypothetical protein